MLKVDTLTGKRFLDIGSGRGLFSLDARRLGAKVHSFDYDPQSVACTVELRRRYFPDDPDWQVKQGSALDGLYLDSLGEFDGVAEYFKSHGFTLDHGKKATNLGCHEMVFKRIEQ